jgi:hypothetical protein
LTVCEWFDLKTNRMVSSGLASKPVVTVFAGLGSKLVATVFAGFASKSMATVSASLASKPVVGFLVEPQNQGGGGFSGLGLKTGSSGLIIWASKSPRRFLCLSLKTKQTSILSVAPQNRRREVGVGHTSRSSTLLDVKASLARVSQSGLKTGGGATTGGARGIIAEVASEAS